MLVAAISSAAALVLTASGFWLLNNNPWPLILSPIALVWLAGYSFTKRFTSLCHLVLGAALGLSPLGAVIAVEPAFIGWPTPWWLALMARYRSVLRQQDERHAQPSEGNSS